MECIYCRGRMKKGSAPFSLNRHGYHIHWDAIPAWICSQCAEPYFESREVEIIQEAARGLDRHHQALLAEAV